MRHSRCICTPIVYSLKKYGYYIVTVKWPPEMTTAVLPQEGMKHLCFIPGDNV